MGRSAELFRPRPRETATRAMTDVSPSAIEAALADAIRRLGHRAGRCVRPTRAGRDRRRGSPSLAGSRGARWPRSHDDRGRPGPCSARCRRRLDRARLRDARPRRRLVRGLDGLAGGGTRSALRGRRRRRGAGQCGLDRGGWRFAGSRRDPGYDRYVRGRWRVAAERREDVDHVAAGAAPRAGQRPIGRRRQDHRHRGRPTAESASSSSTSTPGIDRRPGFEALGMRGSASGRLVLDDVHLPAETDLHPGGRRTRSARRRTGRVVRCRGRGDLSRGGGGRPHRGRPLGPGTTSRRRLDGGRGHPERPAAPRPRRRGAPGSTDRRPRRRPPLGCRERHTPPAPPSSRTSPSPRSPPPARP